MIKENTKPLHPGEVLQKNFLDRNNMQQVQLADHLGWTYARLNEIVNQRRGITADSALAFSEAFGTTPEFWLKIQVDWDLWHAKKLHKPVEPLPKSLYKSE